MFFIAQGYDIVNMFGNITDQTNPSPNLVL